MISSLVYVPLFENFKDQVSTEQAELLMRCLSLEKCDMKDDDVFFAIVDLQFNEELMRFVLNRIIYKFIIAWRADDRRDFFYLFSAKYLNLL